MIFLYKIVTKNFRLKYAKECMWNFMCFPAGNNCIFAMVVYTWDYGAIGTKWDFALLLNDNVKSEYPVDVDLLSWCVLLSQWLVL